MKYKYGLLGVAAGLLLLAFLFLRSSGHRDARTGDVDPVDRARSVAEILRRWQHRPRPPLPRFNPVDERDHRALIDAATNVKAQVQGGDRRWIATAVHLDDLGFVADKRRQCGRTIGAGIREACIYRVDMVVERTAPTTGKIVYTRGVSVEDEPDPLCGPFAECIAESRLGAILPLPEGTDRRVAISQNLQSTRMTPEQRDPKVLTHAMHETKLALEELRKTANLDDPMTILRIQSQENLMKYVERRVAEIEETGK